MQPLQPLQPLNYATFTTFTILLKLTLLHGCCSRFLNWTNGTKSRNAPQIMMLTVKFGSL